MAEAALLRTPEFPGLLKLVFPSDYTDLIDDAEKTFRRQIIDYGGLLWSAPSEDFIITTLADQLATFAVQYLSAEYSKDFTPLQPLLVPFADGSLRAGVKICEAAHYMTEVNATALYVVLQLLLHRVSSLLIW
jgi:hypothetical protein